MTAVPTSAPSITASAADVVSRPCETNEDVSSAVAVELCSSPVTPTPARNACRASVHAAPQDLTQRGAVHAQHAGAHDMRAPDQQGNRGQQIQQCRQLRPLPLLRLVGRVTGH